MKYVKIFGSIVEEEARQQIDKLANYDPYKDAKIRIMPDVHAGKGKTPVAQFDKDGHFIRAYESVCCAERELGIRIAYIFYRGKTCAKGFVFKHISKQCYVALAALRSDSHYMQWYTDGKEWYLYDREEPNGVYAIFNDCHWATVEEIIEHFKK